MTNRDSSTRIVTSSGQTSDAMLARLAKAQTTDEYRLLSVDLVSRQAELERQHAKAVRSKWVWGVAVAVVTALAIKGTWWVLDAGADKAKAAITADVVADVVAVTADVKALKADVKTLATDVGTVKTDIDAHGKTLDAHSIVLDALYQVNVDGVEPKVVKAKAKKLAAKKAAQP